MSSSTLRHSLLLLAINRELRSTGHLIVNEYIQRAPLFRKQLRFGIAPLGLLADDAKSIVTELVPIFANRAKRDVEDIGMQDRILTSIYIVLELRYVKLTR